MDEEELDEYIRQIDAIEQRERQNKDLIEPIRDDDGYIVPGCYRVLPAPAAE